MISLKQKLSVGFFLGVLFCIPLSAFSAEDVKIVDGANSKQKILQLPDGSKYSIDAIDKKQVSSTDGTTKYVEISKKQLATLMSTLKNNPAFTPSMISHATNSIKWRLDDTTYTLHALRGARQYNPTHITCDICHSGSQPQLIDFQPNTASAKNSKTP